MLEVWWDLQQVFIEIGSKLVSLVLDQSV